MGNKNLEPDPEFFVGLDHDDPVDVPEQDLDEFDPREFSDDDE